MQILVLQLVDGRYVEYGPFRDGDRARSLLLGGFEVDVAAAFRAGRS